MLKLSCSHNKYELKCNKLKLEKRLKKLEEDIKYELNKIMECIHKHSIDDYIMELECSMKEMLKKDPKIIEFDFKTNLEIMLNDMFKDIIYETVPRIKTLRKEMIKKYVLKTASNNFDSSPAFQILISSHYCIVL